MDTEQVKAKASSRMRGKAQSVAVNRLVAEYLESDEFRELVLGELRRIAQEKIPGQVKRIVSSGRSPNSLERACVEALKQDIDSILVGSEHERVGEDAASERGHRCEGDGEPDGDWGGAASDT